MLTYLLVPILSGSLAILIWCLGLIMFAFNLIPQYYNIHKYILICLCWKFLCKCDLTDQQIRNRRVDVYVNDVGMISKTSLGGQGNETVFNVANQDKRSLSTRVSLLLVKWRISCFKTHSIMHGIQNIHFSYSERKYLFYLV